MGHKKKIDLPGESETNSDYSPDDDKDPEWKPGKSNDAHYSSEEKVKAKKRPKRKLKVVKTKPTRRLKTETRNDEVIDGSKSGVTESPEGPNTSEPNTVTESPEGPKTPVTSDDEVIDGSKSGVTESPEGSKTSEPNTVTESPEGPKTPVTSDDEVTDGSKSGVIESPEGSKTSEPNTVTESPEGPKTPVTSDDEVTDGSKSGVTESPRGPKTSEPNTVTESPEGPKTPVTSDDEVTDGSKSGVTESPEGPKTMVARDDTGAGGSKTETSKLDDSVVMLPNFLRNEGQFDCTMCEMRYNFKHHLERHFISKHSNFVGYPCSNCGKKFKRKDVLVKH